MDADFMREQRERAVVLYKAAAAARLTGIPELDAPETWRERVFGGWRRPNVAGDWLAHQLILDHRASEADYDYDEYMDVMSLAKTERELENLDAAFGRKFMGDKDRLNLSTAARSAALAKWLADARAASPRRRRLNRAIGRRMDAEVGTTEQFLANKRETDNALLRHIRSNPSVLRAGRFDPRAFESFGWSRGLGELSESSPYDDIVGVSASEKSAAHGLVAALARRE